MKNHHERLHRNRGGGRDTARRRHQGVGQGTPRARHGGHPRLRVRRHRDRKAACNRARRQVRGRAGHRDDRRLRQSGRHARPHSRPQSRGRTQHQPHVPGRRGRLGLPENRRLAHGAAERKRLLHRHARRRRPREALALRQHPRRMRGARHGRCPQGRRVRERARAHPLLGALGRLQQRRRLRHALDPHRARPGRQVVRGRGRRIPRRHPLRARAPRNR